MDAVDTMTSLPGRDHDLMYIVDCNSTTRPESDRVSLATAMNESLISQFGSVLLASYLKLL